MYPSSDIALLRISGKIQYTVKNLSKDRIYSALVSTPVECTPKRQLDITRHNIEENHVSLEEAQSTSVYSVDNLVIDSEKIEKQCEYFNPIMAILITRSARLILPIAEHLAVQNEGYVAYMNTDSIFVEPDKTREIQDFFGPLNPYSANVEMFKIEKDENGNDLNNVLFYGISVKRY